MSIVKRGGKKVRAIYQSFAAQQGDIVLNARAIWPTVASWALLLIFTTLYSMFIGRVLLAGNPFIGKTEFNASTTNLLLSIFSQLYAMLLTFVAAKLLDDLRWSLAANNALGGISALSWAQLSPGTGFFTTGFLAFASRLKCPIGLVKYGFFLLSF